MAYGLKASSCHPLINDILKEVPFKLSFTEESTMQQRLAWTSIFYHEQSLNTTEFSYQI